MPTRNRRPITLATFSVSCSDVEIVESVAAHRQAGRSVLHDQVAGVAKGVGKLLAEEWVALRPAIDEVGQAVGQRVDAEDMPDQRLDGLRGEWAEQDPFRPRLGKGPAELDWRVVAHRSGGQDDEDARDPPDDRQEQGPRAGIHPMGVLQDDDARRGHHRAGDQGDRQVADGIGPDIGLEVRDPLALGQLDRQDRVQEGCPLEEGRIAGQAGEDRGLHGSPVARVDVEELAERATPDVVRGRPLDRIRVADVGPHGTRHLGHEVADQLGLADSGLALDHDHTALAVGHEPVDPAAQG
jgi:hypothetical protein